MKRLVLVGILMMCGCANKKVHSLEDALKAARAEYAECGERYSALDKENQVLSQQLEGFQNFFRNWQKNLRDAEEKSK